MNFKYYKTERLVIFILLLSILYNYVTEKIALCLKGHETIKQIFDYVDIISTLSFILLTFLFINYWGWKWKLFKWLVDIPNLNGRYYGVLVSSYNVNGVPVEKDCAIEIKQTASSIHVFSYYGDKGANTQSSMAFSVSEQIVKEKNEFFKLYYIFTNEPEVLITQLNNHAGTAKFKYFPDIKTLDGDYYNQRQNIGTIKVKFQQKKLLGRLIP